MELVSLRRAWAWPWCPKVLQGSLFSDNLLDLTTRLGQGGAVPQYSSWYGLTVLAYCMSPYIHTSDVQGSNVNIIAEIHQIYIHVRPRSFSAHTLCATFSVRKDTHGAMACGNKPKEGKRS